MFRCPTFRWNAMRGSDAFMLVRMLGRPSCTIHSGNLMVEFTIFHHSKSSNGHNLGYIPQGHVRENVR
jgi:hypothetical protein